VITGASSGVGVELGLAVDVFVNNAGFGTAGLFCDVDIDREVLMVETNLEAAVAFSGAWVPSMVRRRRGAVLIIVARRGVAAIAGNQRMVVPNTILATAAHAAPFVPRSVSGSQPARVPSL
jgi:short-subunit dehydrogenase